MLISDYRAAVRRDSGGPGGAGGPVSHSLSPRADGPGWTGPRE